MREHGVIAAVEGPVPLGSSLAEDATAGATTLTLYDVLDFSDSGGSVLIGVEEVTYSERDVDAATLTVTATASDHFADDAVIVLPSVYRYTAHVQLEGEDDDAVLADVTHALKPMLPVGIRDPGTEESVVIDNDEGQWRVVEVLGAEPVLVGTAIYVPDVDSPRFQVDADGTIAVNSDSFTAFTVDPNGIVRARAVVLPEVDPETIELDGGSGNVRALEFLQFDGLTDTHPELHIEGGAIFFGQGGATGIDTVLFRSAASELTLSDDAMTGPAVLKWGGGAGNGYSRLADNDYVELAKRNADPGAGPTGSVRVYSKVVAGTSKLFAQDDAGGVHALW